MSERITALALFSLVAACSAHEPLENKANATETEAISNEAAPARSEQPSGREPISYTSLKPEDCRLLEQNAEEAGYSRHRCEGLAGYALETTESDLRQGLTVIAPDGKRSALDLSRDIAKGAFNALGPTAEWRGKDPKSPTTLIVRLNIASQPNRPDISNLVVIRLGQPSCVTAVIPPGQEQNDSARDAADSGSGKCLG